MKKTPFSQRDECILRRNSRPFILYVIGSSINYSIVNNSIKMKYFFTFFNWLNNLLDLMKPYGYFFLLYIIQMNFKLAGSDCLFKGFKWIFQRVIYCDIKMISMCTWVLKNYTLKCNVVNFMVVFFNRTK